MRIAGSIFDSLNSIDPDLFLKLDDQVTPERLYSYLKPIADCHAPSQSVPWTRARVIEDLLEGELLKRRDIRFIRNYKQTGNTVLLLGKEEVQKDVWLLAHLDMITYLIESESNGSYPLTPICYHLMEPGRRDAVALGFNLERGEYEILTRGQIMSHGGDAPPEFKPDEAMDLRAGARVCFHSEMSWDRETGKIEGSLDDAGGAAALLVAAVFLAEYDIEVMLGLTDEEEGRAGMGSQSFCRGGARLLRHFGQPSLAIVSDIHEAAEMYGGGGPREFQPGGGASFAEKASSGVGEIVPPHLYELQKLMAGELRDFGIGLRENVDGYVSRTEGINAMLRTPNVALLGFLGKNRHFQRDVESANIHDLVDLAKVVVCYALLTKTPFWKTLVS